MGIDESAAVPMVFAEIIDFGGLTLVRLNPPTCVKFVVGEGVKPMRTLESKSLCPHPLGNVAEIIIVNSLQFIIDCIKGSSGASDDIDAILAVG